MTTLSHYDIIIIGGGVIGTASAFELASQGARVLLLEQRQLANGSSFGNAGWLTPCFAMPLPMPGQFLKALGWLMDAESPLYIKPSFDPLLFRWLSRFMMSMRTDLMLRSVAALTELSKDSLRSYSVLSERFPMMEFQQKGLTMVTKTETGLRAIEQEMQIVAKHGIPGRMLSGEEVQNMEPALRPGVLGGVFFPNEAHVEPLAVVMAFAQAAIEAGAKIETNCEAKDFEVQNGAVRSVTTSMGNFSADKFLIATGAWSSAVAKKLSIRIPVLGGKGYALIVPPLGLMPRSPLMLVEKKIAVTPRSRSLRLAGTLELVNQDFSITQRRVDAILRGSKEFLKMPEDIKVVETWRGLRPCTPDGVPVIGASSKVKNLFFCTGHQMLGLQSAPASAKLAAELMLGKTPSFDPFPFRASRF